MAKFFFGPGIIKKVDKYPLSGIVLLEKLV
jgi:hypothetical protein